MSKILNEFYSNKKVFITGCTGFKGSWMTQMLILLGAKVSGYALEPEEESLFNLLKLKNKIDLTIGDVRDYKKMEKAFIKAQPDIVIHMAAQPLVLESYNNPVYTYDVNMMGTVNICNIIRKSTSKLSFLNVTTDKVYLNIETDVPYKEEDRLNGYDPYSNSKSCSELITSSYKKCFYNNTNIVSSTCRSGNVIGGGDFSENRIIPDSFRYLSNNKNVLIRNPNSIRPYQHVLEPIFVYLKICMMQYLDKKYSSEYNVGPDKSDCLKTIELVQLFCKYWEKDNSFEVKPNNSQRHEANLLMLDNTKIKKILNWKPVWHKEKAIQKTVIWYKKLIENEQIIETTNQQIMEFLMEVDSNE